MSNGGNAAFATLAPLGLVLAPALVQFAEASQVDARATRESTERQCVRTDGAPVHERFRGKGDVRDHLAEGTEVQVIEERKNWRPIAFVSGDANELGWMTAAHIGGCEGILKVPHQGSEMASTDALIAEVDPTFVVISASVRHELPRETVIAHYKSPKRTILTTDRHTEVARDSIVCGRDEDSDLVCSYAGE
jgi:hypothetical protein